YRNIQRLSQNIPQGDVDGADGGDAEATSCQLRHGVAGAAGGVMAHAVIQHFPDDADISRVAADQLWPDFVVEQMDQRAIAAGAAGGVLALAPADQPVVGLDAQDGGIEGRDLAEIAAVLARRLDRHADPPGLNRLDAHGSPRPAAGWINDPGRGLVAKWLPT